MRSGSESPQPRGARAPAWRLGAAGLIGVLAAACSSAPAPTTYDLSAPAAPARGAMPGQLLIASPQAIAVLAGQQILVKDDSGTISFLGSGQWADELPDLVQARLIHTFENASRIRAVARPTSGATADAQLISEIRAFQVATPANEAVVELSAKIVSDQTGRIVNGRLFRARVPVQAVDAANAARALDEALSIVMLEIVRWVGANGVPQRDTPAG
jgi:cholesterol transport system auxiliary component